MKKKMFWDEDEVKGFELLEKIYIDNLKSRKIILNDDIASHLFDTVAMQIKKFNDEDKGKPVDERKPIELHINSFGGEVYSGFSVVSAILSSETPVHGYCDGYVMSMGFLIYLATHKRFCGRFSNFMYHEVSTASRGKNEEMKEVTKENNRLQAMYDSLVLEKTSITKTQLSKVRKNKLDWFFGAEDAIKFGVAHQII